MEFQGSLYSLVMNLHGICDVVGITATHGHGHWEPGRLAGGEDDPIPSRQSVLAHREASQPIANERIGTGEVNGELGVPRHRRSGDTLLEGFEIGCITRPVTHWHGQIAGSLGKGVVALSKNVECENRGIIRKDV
jgi:hypothetical protein